MHSDYVTQTQKGRAVHKTLPCGTLSGQIWIKWQFIISLKKYFFCDGILVSISKKFWANFSQPNLLANKPKMEKHYKSKNVKHVMAYFSPLLAPWHIWSISSSFYVQLLHTQTPKVQKDSQSVLRFWDLCAKAAHRN